MDVFNGTVLVFTMQGLLSLKVGHKTSLGVLAMALIPERAGSERNMSGVHVPAVYSLSLPCFPYYRSLVCASAYYRIIEM